MTALRIYLSPTALLVLAVLLVSPLAVYAQDEAETPSEDQKILYAIGLAVANNLTPFNFDEAELEWVTRGLADAVLGREPEVELSEYGPKIQPFGQARIQTRAEEEKSASQKYLEGEAAREGAQKLGSGLILTEITPGDGESPAADSRVTVHYHGTLRDGTVFDSSVDRGEPATFGLDQVIPCWTEGVQLMKVGGKSRLVCPSPIAYGDMGRPPTIPPGAVLTFEIELIGIAADPAPPASEEE